MSQRLQKPWRKQYFQYFQYLLMFSFGFPYGGYGFFPVGASGVRCRPPGLKNRQKFRILFPDLTGCISRAACQGCLQALSGGIPPPKWCFCGVFWPPRANKHHENTICWPFVGGIPLDIASWWPWQMHLTSRLLKAASHHNRREVTPVHTATLSFVHGYQLTEDWWQQNLKSK